ncbi:proline-, glutamic acid- and leucine-rich protein 1-like, partial [Plectropomus leopardus]|uniref:proline-, glutamic acid- and leucine-rich protein 1-like n=1 Tax=Plectropomus leopardus TaxID=160734 RepID=UPI001C4CE748
MGSCQCFLVYFRLLLALVLVPSPCWPPPLTCAVSILSSGRNERNLKVSSFCTEALTICNSLLHPRTPSMALPLPPLTLKPTPTAPVLPSSQGPAPGLTLPTLLGGPAPGPPFPTRHSLGLGPASLLGSLENHLSLVPGLPGQAPNPGDMLLSPHAHHQQDPAGLGLPEGQRPVFVRYDREEAEDVEISLASDSDDSVVIVPPGMLNMENQQEETAAAANSQNMTSVAPGSAPVTLPGGESVSMVPTTAATTTIDGVSLPNDLATSSPLLTTSTTPINSFPPSSASVVSLVPPLNSSTLPAPPGGLGDSLPGRPQLQQMLMQTSTAGQPGPMGLPLQMHQLQNQLSQQGRHLHQHQPPPPASNEDSAVININSTDEEEEEEEDMEDDEELDEEEEEGMDEEDEEEEASDFNEEEFYEGEEYDDFDEEEGEDLEEEEEEEEDGDIPPLEGAEDKAGEAGVEGGKVLRAAVDDGGMAGFSVEGEAEGGIEEIQTNRSLLGEERIKVQKVESIGVLEEAREGEGEEDESERMDDPTMPQILCVTGGALEEREETEEEGGGPERAGAGEGGEGLQEEMRPWEQGDKEIELTATSEECPTNKNQQ